MTSVSNVKGQKRVCKFKYESQQQLALSLPLCSHSTTQHATWGQVEDAAQRSKHSLKLLPALRLLVRHGKVKLPQLASAASLILLSRSLPPSHATTANSISRRCCCPFWNLSKLHLTLVVVGPDCCCSCCCLAKSLPSSPVFRLCLCLRLLKFPQSRALKVPAVIIRHRAGLQFSTDLS